MQIYLFYLLIGISTQVASSNKAKFYRRDYTYVPESDAFFKVHWENDAISWDHAFATCIDEEAELFYPKNDTEINLAMNMTSNWVAIPNDVVDMFIGVHDEFKLPGFVTIDGHQISPVAADNGDGNFDFGPNKRCLLFDRSNGTFKVGSCYRRPDSPLPYICRKVVEDETCPTVDSGYKYVKNLKKCYKINERPKTWEKAMQTCFMEGGILTDLVQKSDLNDIMDNIPGKAEYYVGFRKMFGSEDFYTVRGKRLSKTWFNSDYQNTKNTMLCGVLNFGILELENMGIRTVLRDCNEELPFICEMNPDNEIH